MSHPLSLGPASVWAIALALALGAAQGAENRQSAARRSAELEVLILSTTSNMGEVEPCG